MFQSVRPNSRAYIFFKGNNAHLEQGFITNQPIQRPKYQGIQAFGQPQETVVDLTIKTDTGTYSFNGIPTNLEVADTFCNGEAAVISDNRDAMSAEIMSLKQKSQDVLDNTPYHEGMIKVCDVAIGILNPEYAEKQERDAEFLKLKSQVDGMSNKLDLLIEKMSLNQ